MAPVTRGRGNHFAQLEDVNDREEPVREEPPATYQAHSEAQFASLREQIAALTKPLSIGSGRDRRRHIPSPHDSEEEDAYVEDEDGNPFAERRVHRHQPLVQAQANRWESGFKLDIPEFQGCFQPKEFLVTEKIEKINKKKVPREAAEIRSQSVVEKGDRFIEEDCLVNWASPPIYDTYPDEEVSSIYQVDFLGDGDQGTTSKDLIQVPIGPVTRARAKKFKDVLNGLIQELWAQANSGRPIEHDPQRQQRIVTLIQVLEG
jgi:hypothetical protein